MSSNGPMEGAIEQSMKSNGHPSGSQPKRPYGRVPVDLLPTISKLSHLDAHVFLVGCILGNRYQGEIGLVPANKTKLAKLCGTTRYRLIQSLRRLETAHLVQLQANGWLFMSHYLDGVSSGDSVSSGGGVTPQEPTSDSSCTTLEPLVEPFQLVADTLNVTTKRAPNGGPHRRPRSQKIVWDETENRLKALDDTWKLSFREQWTETLGEEKYLKEMDKATAWLRGNPDRRKGNARLDKFLLNWMVKCIE